MFSRMVPIQQEQIVLSFTVFLVGVLPALQPNGVVAQYQGVVTIADPLQGGDQSFALTDSLQNWDPTRTREFPEGIAWALYRQLGLKPFQDSPTVSRVLPPPLMLTCRGDLVDRLIEPADELLEWIIDNCSWNRFRATKPS